jgi:hypothetical protein
MPGQTSKKQKHVATKIRKTKTTYIVVFEGSYKQFVYLATRDAPPPKKKNKNKNKTKQKNSIFTLHPSSNQKQTEVPPL